MKLYHLLSVGYGLAAIRDRRFKLSSFDSLNDPFELFAGDLRDPAIRKLYRDVKEGMTKKMAILCCSKSVDNTLLWSHYADRHRGMALELEVVPRQEYLKQFQAYLGLALKAQAQCRATLEALAEIKNPRPMAFVKQANISGGPQQVNNGMHPGGGQGDAESLPTPGLEIARYPTQGFFPLAQIFKRHRRRDKQGVVTNGLKGRCTTRRANVPGTCGSAVRRSRGGIEPAHLSAGDSESPARLDRTASTSMWTTVRKVADFRTTARPLLG